MRPEVIGKERRGFTLIELLVVIAIIGIAMGRSGLLPKASITATTCGNAHETVARSSTWVVSIFAGWIAIGSNPANRSVEGPEVPRISAAFVGTGKIGANRADLSGMATPLGDGTPENRFGGISAIENIPGTNRYLALSDRGPRDGATDFLCRFHELELQIQPESAVPIAVEVIRTRLLLDTNGNPFPGNSGALEPSADRAGRLDPEGLRLDSSGDIYISDEYGPAVLRFSNSGLLQDHLAVPASFRVAAPSGDSTVEDEKNVFGRRSNRGMEGLALSTNGSDLMGLMQSPLLQDMAVNIERIQVGLNTRMLHVDLQSGRQQQFVYQLENPNHKLHEILAVDSGRYLVIEQDGLGGDLARFKQIVLIETDGATALPEDIALPADCLPANILPVRKVGTLDLLDPSYGLAGSGMPEKIEGLCFGPRLADGRRILVVATDNDFRADQDTRFFVFAVSL